MKDEVSPTLREQMKHHEPIVCYSVGADLTWQGCSGLTQTATTLDTAARTLSKSQPKTCAVVCYAEKRFFEWHEDDKSVNIRASSGSYGGAAKCLSVPEDSRSIVRNRPQVDSATTSDARKVDS